ncbi:putative chitinase 3-like [Sarcoptes scabiei]|nr:putative chitinase 3-like [Sarcoptes scabiei]
MSTYTFENDPFADAAITAAVNGSKSNQSNENVDTFDYNPFANRTTTSANIDPFSPVTSEPAVVQASTTTPTAAILSPSNIDTKNISPITSTTTNSIISNNITAEQLRIRQEELDRKAAELAAREAELHRAQRIAGGVRENNFPPLPSFIPCNPCFYQDINVEIEINFQTIVRQVFQLWMFYVFTLLTNFIVCLFAFIEGIYASGGMLFFSLVTVIIFTPLSFICWFRPLYKAFRDDSSFNFMIFFFVFFCQLVLSAVWALGLPGSGAIGLVRTLQYFSSDVSNWFRFLCLICTIVLVFYALASIIILIKVHGIYHKSDLSIQKAQAEFTSRVMSNERVQQMASNAAQTAARQAMNQAFNQQQPPPQTNQPTGFRY